MQQIIQTLAKIAEEINLAATERLGGPTVIANVAFNENSEALMIECDASPYCSEMLEQPLDTATCRQRALVELYRFCIALEDNDYHRAMITKRRQDLEVIVGTKAAEAEKAEP